MKKFSVVLKGESDALRKFIKDVMETDEKISLNSSYQASETCIRVSVSVEDMTGEKLREHLNSELVDWVQPTCCATP